MRKSFVLDWNNYEIKCTAAREICERHHGSPIEGSSETPHTSLHYGIEGFNRSPNWPHYVKKHKSLGQQRQLFPVRKYFVNYMMRYTHRNESLLHDKLNGIREHQKLPICLEPTFWLLPWQSGSFQLIFYPVLLDKNQKLTSQCVKHRSLA